MKTSLCDLLGIDIPVMQAGMGVYRGLVTTSELVAAVSNAGGMGCLGGAGLTPAELQAAIRQIKALTCSPFGVDLLLPEKLSRTEGTRETIRQEIADKYPAHRAWVQSLFDRYNLSRSHIDMEHAFTPELADAQTEVAVAERVPLFVAGLGGPGIVAARVHAYGGKVAGLAGSIRHTQRQAQSGVDLIIAQGSEAGGHVGTAATMPLVPQIVDAVAPCPIAAGGGIADGRGLAAALMLGAQAVRCGTAFLFAEEARIHPIQRDQLLTGQSEDFAATRIYTGKTARTFRNEIHRLWTETGLDPLGMPHQKVLMDDLLDAARTAGRLDIVSNPAGQIAGMLHTVRPAEAIVYDMINQARTCLKYGAALVDLDAPAV